MPVPVAVGDCISHSDGGRNSGQVEEQESRDELKDEPDHGQVEGPG